MKPIVFDEQELLGKPLRPTTLKDLYPTVGTYDEHTSGNDKLVARWYRGAPPEFGGEEGAGRASTYIDSNVKGIMVETAELRALGKLEPFRPGPIGSYKRQPPRVVSEREVADYHRKEREGNRKEMLRLREQNNVALSILGERQ